MIALNNQRMLRAVPVFSKVVALSLLVTLGNFLCNLEIHAADRAINIFVQSGTISPASNAKPMPYSSIVAPADPKIGLVQFENKNASTPKTAEKVSELKASAGDDVLGYVGRRATLNGGLSEPVGKIGMRWIQISGAPIQEAFSQGPNLVVVPPQAGVYQFMLVVAEGNLISQPDTVTLTAVVHPEDEAIRQASLVAPPPSPSNDKLSISTRDLLVKYSAQTLKDVPHTSEHITMLGELFSDISQKMSLYGSYAEANQELSRRISDILGSGVVDVSKWNQAVFEPLTKALSIWVSPAGLDLTNASLWSLPLKEPGRSRLAEGFSAIAEGFQSQAELKTGVDVKPVSITEPKLLKN